MEPLPIRLCEQLPWGYLTLEEQQSMCGICPYKPDCMYGKKATETHCKWGHVWSESTTKWRTTHKGTRYRVCKICIRINRRRSQKKKDATGYKPDKRKATETHCKWGHPWTEESILWNTSSSGKRYKTCRVCMRDADRRYYNKQKN